MSFFRDLPTKDSVPLQRISGPEQRTPTVPLITHPESRPELVHHHSGKHRYSPHEEEDLGFFKTDYMDNRSRSEAEG